MMRKLADNFHLNRYGLYTRLVQEEDAGFIVSLRTDPRLSKYIHYTSSSIEDQKNWIRNYKIREAEGLDYYFIFFLENKPQGLARIYDITEDSFTQGSWIFSPDALLGTSVLGNIISLEIGFDFLDKKIVFSDARIGNNTHKYVKSLEPEVIKTDELNVYYKISLDNFNKNKVKHIERCQKVIQIALKDLIKNKGND